MEDKREPSLRFEAAEQLFTIIKPEPEISKLMAPGMSTINFLNTLAQKDLLPDAIRYLAIALPRREAIWWACATHRTLGPDPLDDIKEQDAWRIVEEWVYNPTEDTRNQTYAIADTLGYQTPGAYGAMAVFWSGGSIAPPESGQIVPPGPGLTGTAVGASILMTCSKGEPKGAAERQKEALRIGLDVAYGGNGLQQDKK
jgi:hypothetical protein